MPIANLVLITHFQKVGKFRYQAWVTPAKVERIGVINKRYQLKEIGPVYFS